MALKFSTSIDMLTGDSADSSAGVTVDTTGPAIDVSLRQLRSIQFKRTVHTSGNTVFTVEICNGDPSVAANWVAYARLTSNVVNSISEGDVRVASVTLSSATSSFVFIPVGDFFRYIRCKSDVTTDGTSFAYLECA